ncbi:MAG: hypothetical protein EP299_14010 [Acidobacteria bacterium]|nr:MAG: hypothetical protein EP299_14010 [Acidobacteriota bacterium]
MREPESRDDTLSTALRLLAKEVRRRILRHSQGHLLSGGNDTLKLTLRLPATPRGRWLERAAGETSTALDEALRELLLHRTVFQPGSVYCLRCRSARCEHTQPTQSTAVFSGYSPSGVPHFLELGQWLLEHKDPRVDQLYRKPPRLLARVTLGSDLTGQLLPAFRDLDSGYHIHGQVAAGWFRYPDANGLDQPLALTFQVVSSQPANGPKRFGLNLIGRVPGDEPLETLFDRAGELPWAAPAQWAQGVLGQVERSLTRKKAPEDETIDKRLEGLLNGLARRLERERRARARRTAHGHQRHREKDRPTWKAQADLAAAREEELLFDTRRETLIVLGDRGRAHVFNQAGKLVTSIRYSPYSIERRRKNGIWRPATSAEIRAFKEHLEVTTQAHQD